MNERDEAHYRTMLAGGASVNAQLAAAAVYAARHGTWSAGDAHTDEYAAFVRQFRADHGDTVPADVILSAMDSARRAERYGKLVRGWDWRTTPDLLAEAEALATRLGMNRTQLLEHALRRWIEETATRRGISFEVAFAKLSGPAG